MLKKIYIKNMSPVFIPKIKENKTFIKKIKNLEKIDITKNIINSIILPIDFKTGNILPRFRKLNRHRESAMKSIIQGMLYYYDNTTKMVNASIKQLSDECGLSTISTSGNKSITRASRLISEFMEPMGFVKYEKVKFKKRYLKRISLTPLFFMLLDPIYQNIKIKNENITLKKNQTTKTSKFLKLKNLK